MIPCQLDLFEEYTENTQLKADVNDVRLRLDNLRKGFFARENQRDKTILQILKRLDLIEELMKK